MNCLCLQEVLRKDWLFKLVGSESFEIGSARCVIKIEPMGGFAYEYSLEVSFGCDYLLIIQIVHLKNITHKPWQDAYFTFCVPLPMRDRMELIILSSYKKLRVHF